MVLFLFQASLHYFSGGVFSSVNHMKAEKKTMELSVPFWIFSHVCWHLGKFIWSCNNSETQINVGILLAIWWIGCSVFQGSYALLTTRYLMGFSSSRGLSDCARAKTTMPFPQWESGRGLMQWDQPEPAVAMDSGWEAPSCQVCSVPSCLQHLRWPFKSSHRHRLLPGTLVDLLWAGGLPGDGKCLLLSQETRPQGSCQEGQEISP